MKTQDFLNYMNDVQPEYIADAAPKKNRIRTVAPEMIEETEAEPVRAISMTGSRALMWSARAAVVMLAIGIGAVGLNAIRAGRKLPAGNSANESSLAVVIPSDSENQPDETGAVTTVRQDSRPDSQIIEPVRTERTGVSGTESGALTTRTTAASTVSTNTASSAQTTSTETHSAENNGLYLDTAPELDLTKLGFDAAKPFHYTGRAESEIVGYGYLGYWFYNSPEPKRGYAAYIYETDPAENSYDGSINHIEVYEGGPVRFIQRAVSNTNAPALSEAQLRAKAEEYFRLIVPNASEYTFSNPPFLFSSHSTAMKTEPTAYYQFCAYRDRGDGMYDEAEVNVASDGQFMFFIRYDQDYASPALDTSRFDAAAHTLADAIAQKLTAAAGRNMTVQVDTSPAYRCFISLEGKYIGTYAFRINGSTDQTPVVLVDPDQTEIVIDDSFIQNYASN